MKIDLTKLYIPYWINLTACISSATHSTCHMLSGLNDEIPCDILSDECTTITINAKSPDHHRPRPCRQDPSDLSYNLLDRKDIEEIDEGPGSVRDWPRVPSARFCRQPILI